MAGNSNSGRRSPAYVAREALDTLALAVAKLLENEAGARSRCVIDLVRAIAEELPATLDGARWGPPSHARRPRPSPVPGISDEDFARIRAEEEALGKEGT